MFIRQVVEAVGLDYAWHPVNDDVPVEICLVNCVPYLGEIQTGIGFLKVPIVENYHPERLRASSSRISGGESIAYLESSLRIPAALMNSLRFERRVSLVRFLVLHKRAFHRIWFVVTQPKHIRSQMLDPNAIPDLPRSLRRGTVLHPRSPLGRVALPSQSLLALAGRRQLQLFSPGFIRCEFPIGSLHRAVARLRVDIESKHVYGAVADGPIG